MPCLQQVFTVQIIIVPCWLARELWKMRLPDDNVANGFANLAERDDLQLESTVTTWTQNVTEVEINATVLPTVPLYLQFSFSLSRFII